MKEIKIFIYCLIIGLVIVFFVNAFNPNFFKKYESNTKGMSWKEEVEYIKSGKDSAREYTDKGKLFIVVIAPYLFAIVFRLGRKTYLMISEDKKQ